MSQIFLFSCKNRKFDFLYITYTMLHDANTPHRFCTSGECIHCDCIRPPRDRWQGWSRSAEELKYLCATRHRICIRKSQCEEVDHAAKSRSFSICIHLRKNIFIYFYLATFKTLNVCRFTLISHLSPMLRSFLNYFNCFNVRYN